MIDVSIVIATYERPRRLLRTLRSLNRNLGSIAFEVIVVDDGSGAAMTGVLEAAEPKYPYRLVWLQHSSSLSICRNHGVNWAGGSVILFLDDDLVTPPSLVERHWNAHKTAANRVVIGLRNTVPAGVWEHSSSHSFNYLEQYVVPDPRPYTIDQESWRRFPWVYMAGCHFSLARSFFEAAGGFDEAYCGWGFEDVDLAYRLFRRGAEFQLLHEPIAVHLDDPALRRSSDGFAPLGPGKLESYAANGNLFAARFHDDPVVRSLVTWDRARRTSAVTTFGDFFPHPALHAVFHSESSADSDESEEISIPSELSLLTEYAEKDEERVLRPIHTKGERNDTQEVSTGTAG